MWKRTVLTYNLSKGDSVDLSTELFFSCFVNERVFLILKKFYIAQIFARNTDGLRPRAEGNIFAVNASNYYEAQTMVRDCCHNTDKSLLDNMYLPVFANDESTVELYHNIGIFDSDSNAYSIACVNPEKDKGLLFYDGDLEKSVYFNVVNHLCFCDENHMLFTTQDVVADFQLHPDDYRKFKTPYHGANSCAYYDLENLSKGVFRCRPMPFNAKEADIIEYESDFEV